ncbi:MAG TPA: PIN domain-containing protein [Acidimicrobiales bacterium]|nr:PIN domain-containing protein [Acidimicrobiales bacterium]
MLDSEGLWAIARNDSEDARALLASSREAGVPVLVPAVVLAETLFGDNRDAMVNQRLKKLEIVPVTEPLARAAAELKRLAGMTGVAGTVDAIVVAVSAGAGGGAVLTADVGDIRKLASNVEGFRIRPIRV